MTCAGTNGTSLAQLQAPRRNRYFYGKLLDVLHLTMEQQYAIAGSAHLNRLNFGPGVLCGLGVTALNRDDGHGVRVEPGVAFDALGRRIVVPDRDRAAAAPAHRRLRPARAAAARQAVRFARAEHLLPGVRGRLRARARPRSGLQRIDEMRGRRLGGELQPGRSETGQAPGIA